jgi:hypothetical protein
MARRFASLPALSLPAAALMALAAVVSAGCGAAQAGPGTPSGAAPPRWEGRAHELFDDNIDPASVGLSMDGGPAARSDPLIRERAQTADLVARLRVQTVTVDSVGEESTYHLGLEVGFPALATPKIPDRTVEVSIRSGSAAFGIARQFDARLRGRTFIGFVERFSTEDGEAVLHFHLSADTADVAAAVKEAVALREISGS